MKSRFRELQRKWRQGRADTISSLRKNGPDLLFVVGFMVIVIGLSMWCRPLAVCFAGVVMVWLGWMTR